MVNNRYRFNKILLKILSLIAIIVLLFGCATETNPKENLSNPKENISEQEEKMAQPEENSSPSETNSDSLALIQHGTKVEDLDIGGLPYDDAEKLIDKWQKSKLEQTIMLDCNKSVIPVSLQDLGATIDQAKILSEVKSNPGQTIKVMVQLDSVKANKSLNDKLAKFKQPDSEIKKIFDQINNQPVSQIPKQINVALSNNPGSQGTAAAKAPSANGIIAEFSTNYSVYEKNRSFNLAKAAKALNQKKLNPGEVFSFNAAVGERTEATGYKNAKIIKEKRYVKDIGGGICQVTSTLYSAVILANLQVIQREPHEVAVTYIPLGQDATVYYPNVDFKFKNSTNSPIIISASANSGKLTIRLYGKKTGNKVQFKHQIEKVIRGRAGTKGYVVNTWKIVKDAQGHETKSFLSRDVYAPLKKT